MRFLSCTARRLVMIAAAALMLSQASVFGQTGQPAPTPAPAERVVTRPTRQVSIDEAVKLALEQNLNVQAERLNPQVQDLTVAQARTAWTPSFSAGVYGRTQDAPPSSFLSGGTDVITTRNAGTELSVAQLLPWGMNYNVAWDSSRMTTNNIFTQFDPQLTSNITAVLEQPLLRNFRIDSARWQLLASHNTREVADIDLRQTIATTVRSVKNAYWEYKYALASLDVARQSLELAQESLRNTRSRVEIGTLAPIDIVQAESEVAQREEAVIVAEAAIGQAEDRLRSLIFDPSTPEFWNMSIEPIDPVPFQVQAVDVDGAVRRALAERTDIAQTKKTLERTSLDERFHRNQTMPDVNVRVNYNATGLAGSQLLRGEGAFPPPVIGTVQRPYSDLLRDVFKAAFPTWQFTLNVSYPIGTSSAEASLAQTRLQARQSNIQLRSLELQVATEVRDVARQLVANAKRVDATRAARVLAERQLEAEEKKFTAGMSTSFQVFQYQRDLSAARNRELRATLDYTQSQVDFETVQVAPVGGGGSFSPTLGGSIATTGGATTTGTTTTGTGGATTTGGSTGNTR
jgi:outer membrane protein